MSFDVFFAPIVSASDESWTPTREALLGSIVSAHGGPNVPDEHGYFFENNDAGFEFYAGSNEGGMLALRGIQREHLEFIFDVMRKMDWGVLVEGKFLVHRLLNPDEESEIPESECPWILIPTPDDVGRALAGNFEKWSHFRDSAW